MNQIGELKDYLKSNCRSWENDCDNYDDTVSLTNHLQEKYPNLSFDEIFDIAKDWTGFEELNIENLKNHLNFFQTDYDIVCNVVSFDEFLDEIIDIVQMKNGTMQDAISLANEAFPKLKVEKYYIVDNSDNSSLGIAFLLESGEFAHVHENALSFLSYEEAEEFIKNRYPNSDYLGIMNL